MVDENNKPTTRLGEIPAKIRLKTPAELAASKQESGPLIGGKDSSWAGSFLGNVVEGAAGVVASPFKAIDRALATAAGTEYREDVASPISKLGQGIEQVAGAVGSGDPNRAADFSSKLGQGLGSTVGFLAAAPFGGLGMAALGAAATGVEQAEDYEGTVREQGGTIDPTKQGQALFAGMLPGTLEAVPLVKALSRLDDVAKGGLSAAVKNTAKGTVEEALQEGIQSTAQNLIASDLIKYDPERNMFFDTPEAAAVGGGVGFILNSAMSALGLRQRGKYTETALKAMDDTRQQTQKSEEEQAKINPATGEPLENSDIANTKKLIDRYSRLASTDLVNTKAYEARVQELEKELRTKYFTKDAESGEYTSSAADRQEATDVLTRIKVEEVEQIDAATAPFEGDVDVAEADPFPSTKGIRINKDITNPKRIAKFNEDLARILSPEEITVTGLEEAFPSAQGIGVEKVEPTIEEIDLDTTPAPQEKPFFDDRPAKADQLQRITEQRKRRDETDAAFEARKEAEINEAYRQRELQIADQPAVAETTPEQTEVGTAPEGSIVTKKGVGYKSEAMAQANMKRMGIDGTITEYAPDQFAIIPKETQDGQKLQGQTSTEEIIKQAQKNITRQAFPGEIADNIQGPFDLRRQAGLPVDLDTLPPTEPTTTTDDVLPSLRDRAGIPTPNGEVAAPSAQTVDEEGVVTGDDLITVPNDETDGIQDEAPTRIIKEPETVKEPQVDPVARDAGTQAISRIRKESVQLTDITTKAGDPFKTSTVAKAQLKRKGIIDSHDVVEVEGGYVLRPKATIQDTIDDVVDDEAGFVAAGSDTSTSMIDQVIESPVEKPEQISLDAEIYDEVIRFATEMRASNNPQRYAEAIAEAFGNVNEFLIIYSGIESGKVVRGGITETQTVTTPVGTVESEEVVTTDPVETAVPDAIAIDNSLDEIESRLNAIDTQVQDLQDELDSGYAENPSDIKKQIARLRREQNGLEKQQQGMHGAKQEISKKEQSMYSALEHSVEVIEDEDLIVPSENVEKIVIDSVPRARPATISMTKRVVDRFVKNIDPAFAKFLNIHVVVDGSEIADPIIREDWIEKHKNGVALGLHYNPYKGTNKHTITIHPREGKTEEDIEWTLFHEIIGHFGFKRMFGPEWKRFMELALKNPELAGKAFALRKRWTGIRLKPKDGETTITLLNNYDYTPFKPGRASERFTPKKQPVKVEVSLEGMRALMDEYIAEIAGNMSNRTFRDATQKERSFINRVLAWLRHFFRKSGFGRISSKVTDGDLLAFVGESYARITGSEETVNHSIVNETAIRKIDEKGLGGDLKALYKETAASTVRALKVHKENVSRLAMFEVDDPASTSPAYNPSDYLVEAQAAVDSVVELSMNLGHVKTKEEAKAILRSIDAREGRLDNSAHHRRIERVGDWLRRSRIGKVMSSTGHLPMPRVLNSVENLAKGGIEKGQLMARRFAARTKNLNDIQKKAIYDYFKTKDADVNTLPLDDGLKRLVKENKDYIENLGESMVVMGVLRRETWEADRGSYLSVRYWRYLQDYYAAGGKRMSLQNYLKKQKGLSDVEKAALGEIKDPSFLVPETIATISRDVALNGMFKNIITLDEVGKLGWTLGERQFTEVNGKKMKLSDIEKKIESLEFLRDAEEDINPLYKTPEGQQEIERQLDEYYAARDTATEALRSEVREILSNRDITEVSDDMINQVLNREYVKVNDKRYGALHKKYIRKELYDELIESGQMYDKNHSDFFSKTFGAGGTADRANQVWKSFKVTLNPPSWFRNGIGNMILMDLGTNTPIHKLVGMTVDEVNSWIKGSPSKYFQIAHDNGLWATTYSAAELNLMSQQFQDAFKTQVSVNNEHSFLKKFGFMFDEKLKQILEKGSEIYGGMEGFFKTVALRDYIQRWETNSGVSLEQAEPDVRDAVIREAVEAANNNIFDYSKVPGWMRTMRRMPFVGAPFLTYTFKAFPYVMDSFARRPQKFIKYMAMPYILAQAFMMNQDLDDDDYDEIMRKLPSWQKEKSSIYLLPWKDSNGNFQTMDFGYYLPWAPFQNLSLMAANTFDVSNPLISSGNVALKLGTDLGFLGGPMPQMINAALTNKDPFSGREIIRTVGTAGDKQNDFMRYMIDMWTPTFLTSKGVLGRTLDNLGIEPTAFNTGQQLNSLGKDKETFTQSSLRGIGVSVRPVDPQLELRNKVKTYQYEKRKLETARRQIFKDRNLSPESRASKIREMNEQIKLLNKKHREEIYGG